MANISSAGIGSGLDVDGIVQSLMKLERRPLDFLQVRQNQFEAQLSDFGQVKSALSTFQSALNDLGSISKFQVNKGSSSDDTIFTASTTSSAIPGSYAIRFDDDGINQLAVADKKNSTVAVADADTSISATGSLRIEVGNASNYFDVVIDSSNDTLSGIRDAINNASDNAGVTATIINADGGPKLILTSNDTGTNNAFTLSDQSGNVAATLGMTDIVTAQDAVVNIDGFTVTSNSNSITSAIQGVTIELGALDTLGVSQTLSITRDNEKVSESVQAFVDAFNTLRGVLSSARAGNLNGDNTLLSIENRIRGIMNTSPSGVTTAFNYLSEIGITTQEGGDLALDTTKLTAALDQDFSGIAQMMANDPEGYTFRLKNVMDDFLGFDGLVTAKEDGLNARIDQLDDQQFNMEYRLQLIERRYRDQFSALDTLVSNMQATSTFLTQQLAALPQIQAQSR
jgi:flagellar hook-associated protein 2